MTLIIDTHCNTLIKVTFRQHVINLSNHALIDVSNTLDPMWGNYFPVFEPSIHSQSILYTQSSGLLLALLCAWGTV